MQKLLTILFSLLISVSDYLANIRKKIDIEKSISIIFYLFKSGSSYNRIMFATSTGLKSQLSQDTFTTRLV